MQGDTNQIIKIKLLTELLLALSLWPKQLPEVFPSMRALLAGGAELSLDIWKIYTLDEGK